MLINNEELQRRINKRLEKDKLYKVGDMVTIRSVEDMIKEYGRDNIKSECPHVLYRFPDSMNCYCGHSYKITDKLLNVDGKGYKYWLDTADTDMKDVGYQRSYMFSSDMFELPEGKEVGND